MTVNTDTQRTYDALLLDIGDVITAPVWDQFDELEPIIGRAIIGRGPLDPDNDPTWHRYLSGELTFAEYWEEFSRLNGFDDWRTLFRHLTVELPHRFGDPLAYELMADGSMPLDERQLMRADRDAAFEVLKAYDTNNTPPDTVFVHSTGWSNRNI